MKKKKNKNIDPVIDRIHNYKISVEDFKVNNNMQNYLYFGSEYNIIKKIEYNYNIFLTENELNNNIESFNIFEIINYEEIVQIFKEYKINYNFITYIKKEVIKLNEQNIKTRRFINLYVKPAMDSFVDKINKI